MTARIPHGMTFASPWNTTPEASAYTKRTSNEILAAAKAGALIGHQNGPRGRWLFHVDDLDAWIRGEVSPARPVNARRAS